MGYDSHNNKWNVVELVISKVKINLVEQLSWCTVGERWDDNFVWDSSRVSDARSWPKFLTHVPDPSSWPTFLTQVPDPSS